MEATGESVCSSSPGRHAISVAGKNHQNGLFTRFEMAKRTKTRKHSALLYVSSKGYPRFCAGPLRDQYLHRVIAKAMLGRELRKDEQVEHRDRNKLNFDPDNLLIIGAKDHGWVSAKQAWFMRQKDGKLKQEFDEFMADKKAEQHAEMYGGG